MKSQAFRTFVRILLMALLVAAKPSHAQTSTWTNKAGGFWSQTGKWDPNATPGPTTNVFLTNTFTAAGTVTSDVPNAVFGDLVMSSPSFAKRLLVNTNGFNPAGNVTLGTNSTLNLSGFAMTVGGGMTLSNAATVAVGTNGVLAITRSMINYGTVLITNNGTVNVGGGDQASAMASGVTLTNAAGGSIDFGGITSSTPIRRLNASTNGVGILNQGTLDARAGNGTFLINALLVNDTNGTLVAGRTAAPTTLTIDRFSTNLGTVFSLRNAFTVLHGDLVNEGMFLSASAQPNSGFALTDGAQTNSFINASDGQLFLDNLGGNNALNYLVKSLVNRGTMVVSNTVGTSAVGTLAISGSLTNANGGVLVFSKLAQAGAFDPLGATLSAATVVNEGQMVGVGGVNNLFTNLLTVNYLSSPVANRGSGVLMASNGDFLVLLNLDNQATLVVRTNSVMGVGAAGAVNQGRAVAGTSAFGNKGILQLEGGSTFAASFLTNLAGATLSGRGEIGTVAFSNLVSAGSSTNWVRQFVARDVANSGVIAPDGWLNAGRIFNTNGGLILGKGTIVSLNVTNYYSGETLVTSTNTNGAGAGLYNSNATVLASGGTLALGNGFLNGLQFGVVGTTNGGTLQVADGTTSVLTNRGGVSMSGGAFVLGSLVNEGTISGTGAIQAASVTSSGTLAPGFSPGALGFSSNLTFLSGSALNMEIAGTNLVDYDRLLVSGVLTLGGTLNVTFLSFTPTGGEQFNLFDFASALGNFAATNLPSLGGGLVWDFSQFNAQGVLGIVNAIPETSAMGAVAAGLALLAFLRSPARGRRRMGPRMGGEGR